MSIISATECIRCIFDSDYLTVSNSKDDINDFDVFYAETKNLKPRYTELNNFITNDEKLRSNKFHSIEDRETYVSCHALLRLILSKRLNINPLELSFINEINNKPALIGYPVYFNITHTRDVFAFAISSNHYVGIDIEKINKNIDIFSLLENYFSKKEREYILEFQDNIRDRFFLLWTRKEALLKALGIGLINDLNKVEVSEQENVITKKYFDNKIFDTLFKEHYIYSKKCLSHYLSIAIPQKAEIILNRINENNIDSYLD